jgi:hypothetical protein
VSTFSAANVVVVQRQQQHVLRQQQLVTQLRIH